VLTIVDLPGHYNFKAKLKNEFLCQALGVIIVVDSNDKFRVQEAAEFLFDVISDIDIAISGVPIMICCNKQDLILSKRAT
jgi:signal recognition particle receptor subunit beta